VGSPSDKPAEADVATARQRARLRHIREGAAWWGEHGTGTPTAIRLGYVAKAALFAAFAVAITAVTTPALGGLGRFGSWWSEPVFFQKTVVWALLFEVLGVGCSAGPLTQRIRPLIGGVLYWLHPGTLRLPPWPGRVPGTAGTVRSRMDVALYAIVLAAAAWALCMPGTTVAAGATLQPWVFAPLAGMLALLGLRDKTIFLAARAEHYWVLVVVMMFPLPGQLLGAKLLTVLIWWGAALSKVNRHFPAVVAVMMSNSPLHRWKWLRRRLYRDFPRDMRPSWLAAAHAHTGTAVEFSVPLVLLVSHGTVTWVAVFVMVLFHLNIIGMFPMGVPFEWNLMMVFSAVVLFGGHSDLGLGTPFSPLMVAVVAVSALLVLAGNLWPSKVSFLFSMRYYAGNWATSMWCFRGDSEDRVDAEITKVAPSVRRQLIAVYGEDAIDAIAAKQPVFRAMHLQGRALNGLLPRALDGSADYRIIDGEVFVNPLLGWNFGDGHLHHEQLLDALRQRCRFEPGELRVVLLESQPLHRQRQHYRIIDAATGLLEQGYVTVRDMAVRQPWLSDDHPGIPVRAIEVADGASR
jgi:Transmembrane protein of unknown function (DUF3556)